MPLDQLANIAEISAAALLIVSLIYVGIQIKQNTAATQAAGRQAYVDTLNNLVGLVSQSVNLADILDRGANGLSNLKSGETLQFCAFIDQCFITFETYYFQWKAGALDARLWGLVDPIISGFMVQTGQQQWWETRRHWYDQEFQEYVNQMIDTKEAKPMHPFSIEPSKAT